MARLPSSRHAVHRRLWILDRRAGDDSPLRTLFLHAVPGACPTRQLSTQRICPRGLQGVSRLQCYKTRSRAVILLTLFGATEAIIVLNSILVERGCSRRALSRKAIIGFVPSG
jgi:hypothetical protein